MPIPQFPNLPDNDPVEALRLYRNYLRDMVNYFSPLKVAAIVVTVPSGFILVAYLIFGLDAVLSWGSDFVPLAFTLVGIILTLKKLREEHHAAVIALLVGVGIIGTVVLHLSRTRTESAHAKEITDLRSRMDSVGTQNTQLLGAFVAKPPQTSQEAELDRRKNIQKALRGEYILSHNNVSPGLLAGNEFPQADWMNKRLRELGEKWTMTPPLQLKSSVTGTTPLPEGKVIIWVAMGDDNASGVITHNVGAGTDPTTMTCADPFACWSEDQLKTTRLPLDFVNGKTKRRLFFLVADTGGVISHPDVSVVFDYEKLADVKGLSLSTPMPTAGAQSGLGFQWAPTVDFLPYNKTKAFYVFIADVDAKEAGVSDFAIVFKITGSNLDAHTVPAFFHINKQ